MNNILITGSTGQLGTAVIETLLKTIPSSQISVLTRNPEKQSAVHEQGFNAFPGSYTISPLWKKP